MKPNIGVTLFALGLVIAIVGLFLHFKISLPFGNLPGDIQIKGENYSIYIPITTSILLSVLLSLLFQIFNR